ncbi:hypothetical protein Salat_2536900 [Sesamum alatum]|uniref:GAG-pre-integrase domain-containing protein n=1 Tax=Sesamum alatum TaxID=300844 RepID=A0AAE1XS52_9LAMI|nr:hypothetical protein Salat_2536900 [Sesamum alatum]
MDSGSSSHMTVNSEVFIRLHRSAKTRIKMVDGMICHIEGKEVIKLNSGEGSYIRDVLYVSDLGSNLLSVGQLLREGYSLLFENLSCIVFTDKTKKNLLLKVPMLRNNMFPLVISDEKNALPTSLEDGNWLWHHRYGHLNSKSLSLLSNQNLVNGLPIIRHIDAINEAIIQDDDEFTNQKVVQSVAWCYAMDDERKALKNNKTGEFGQLAKGK